MLLERDCYWRERTPQPPAIQKLPPTARLTTPDANIGPPLSESDGNVCSRIISAFAKQLVAGRIHQLVSVTHCSLLHQVHDHHCGRWRQPRTKPSCKFRYRNASRPLYPLSTLRFEMLIAYRAIMRENAPPTLQEREASGASISHSRKARSRVALPFNSRSEFSKAAPANAPDTVTVPLGGESLRVPASIQLSRLN